MATDGVHQEKKNLRSTLTSLNMSEPSTKYTHFIEEYIVCLISESLEYILYPSSFTWHCVQIISLVPDHRCSPGDTGDIAAELPVVMLNCFVVILQEYSFTAEIHMGWDCVHEECGSQIKPQKWKVQTARSGIKGLRIYHLQRLTSEKGWIRVSTPRVGRILDGKKWSGRYEERMNERVNGTREQTGTQMWHYTNKRGRLKRCRHPILAKAVSQLFGSPIY